MSAVAKPRLFVVAGEASGDQHGASLIREILRQRPSAEVLGLGGDKMAQAGCKLRLNLVEGAVMGFVEVVTSFPRLRRALAETAQFISNEPPDALILIDFPEFNLRLAESAHRSGIPIVYYVSPQIWAWRSYRLRKIARLVTKMLVILPFEEELYRSADVNVEFVGHPLLDQIAEAAKDDGLWKELKIDEDQLVIGLLPGSRAHEIRRLLPVMIKTAELVSREIPGARFIVPCSSETNFPLVKSCLADTDLPADAVLGKMFAVLDRAIFCLAKSGTASLEATCFGTPMIILYKAAHLSWALARPLVRVPHIGMANILAGKEIVPEYVQYGIKPRVIAAKALELIRDGETRDRTIREMRKVKDLLGAPGASRRAAEVVLSLAEDGPD